MNPIKPFENHFIQVQTRDSIGNSLTSGGETFYIYLKNHCEWTANYK